MKGMKGRLSQRCVSHNVVVANLTNMGMIINSDVHHR